jgi:hypothetical protein
MSRQNTAAKTSDQTKTHKRKTQKSHTRKRFKKKGTFSVHAIPPSYSLHEGTTTSTNTVVSPRLDKMSAHQRSLEYASSLRPGDVIAVMCDNDVHNNAFWLAQVSSVPSRIPRSKYLSGSRHNNQVNIIWFDRCDDANDVFGLLRNYRDSVSILSLIVLDFRIELIEKDGGLWRLDEEDEEQILHG